jgi:5-methylcytosine-specific restriction protein B
MLNRQGGWIKKRYLNKLKMISKNITKEHILQAMQDIDENGIEYPLMKSRKYDLLFNGKTYPPKLVISIANKFASGDELSWKDFGTNDAHKCLKNLSSDFIIQQKELDVTHNLLEKYKAHIRKTRLEDELYKWKLLGQYKGRPDLTAKDFLKEIKSIDYKNLMYHNGKAVAYHIAKERPEQYRECFKKLFNENIPLKSRLSLFDEETLKIYRELEHHLQHHHDERTMSTFLTFRDPEKYTFYKDSFYKKYCNLIEVDAKKKGEKYVHYLELINELITEYINEDQELLDLINDIIPTEFYQDPEHNILAQDVLFQMLDKSTEQEQVVALMASDNTGWQDSHIEELGKNDASIVRNTKLPSGTTETMEYLRNRIDEEDSFNLFYCSGGNVNYKATVIDFAVNQEELDEKKWDNQIKNIYGYYRNFDDYERDGRKKRIIFLVNDFKKIEPIPVSEFQFYGKFKPPTQDNLSPIKHEPENYKEPIKIESSSNMNNQKENSLNQILFGPPGTGKTYHTIDKAIAIVNPEFDLTQKRKIVKQEYDRLVNEGQIVFTTFHQSMNYEDFIEGIKPIEPKEEGQAVIYLIVDGIFKKSCAIAAYNCYQIYKKSKIRPYDYSFEDLYEAFIESIQDKLKNGNPPVYKTIHGREVEVKDINRNDSIIARAKNSVAKSSAPLTKENMQKLYDKFKSIEEIENLKQVQETVQVTPRITEFYALFSGLKEFEKKDYTPDKEMISESNEVEVFDYEEILKKFNAGVYKEAIKTFGKEGKPVVLIIDEINRGNVSQIFGELITLIEKDKRLGNDEALEVTLPYSKEKFSVPSNLYIIGTMNTADRSVEALDAALRRRFSFVEMPSKPELLSVVTKDDFANYFDDVLSNPLDHNEFDKEIEGINLRILLYVINQRIEKLLDKDHLVGHSYFMEVSNLNELKESFQNKIIPLLQEYFFGDFGKIGLVLGEDFFEPVKSVQSKLFSKFHNYDFSDFSERIIYKLKDLNILSDEDFKNALNTLLEN